MVMTPSSSELRDVLAAPVTPKIGTGSVDKVLEAVRTHLSMDVAFVSEFRTVDRLFRHVDAKDRSPIQPGDCAPLDQGYCQRVVDGRLPQLIADTARLPAAMQLPETQAIPIGSHLSVPIRLADGRIYGTFCCFSYCADPTLSQRDLQFMRAFADLLADQINQDVERSRTEDAKRERVLDAFAEQRLRIVYQPIVNLQTQRMVGAECLSRFQRTPVRSPDLWFAEAAEVGLLTRLELFAIDKALANLSALDPDVYLAVNASPETIIGPGLMRLLEGVDARRVVLEITEHDYIADYAPIRAQLAQLRELGVRVAVDDAGAGYASMRHILNIQPDLIKLDMSLTRSIDSDPTRRALASALIAFARETGASIVAEGVESTAELQTLRGLGATRAQGYLLGRPMALEDVVEYAGSARAESFHIQAAG